MVIEGASFEFTCYKCGREANLYSELCRTRKEAAEVVDMKNTRWGSRCIPSCDNYEEK